MKSILNELSDRFRWMSRKMGAAPQPEGRSAFLMEGWVYLGAFSLVLLGLTLLIIFFDLDREVADLFYTASRGWFLGDKQPWHFLYHWGTIPGLLLSLVSLAAWIYCAWQGRGLRWERYWLLMLLTSLLGAGLMVNALLKPYWGRPRPKQVVEYGGRFEYRHVTSPAIPGQGKSFACGHSTMGFLFCAFIFFKRRNRPLAVYGTLFGLGLGLGLSLARIVQGAHFVSDTLWSFGTMMLISGILYYFVLRIPSQETVSTLGRFFKHRYQ